MNRTNKNQIALVILLALIIAGGVYYFKNSQKTATISQPINAPTSASVEAPTSSPASSTIITYTDNGFSPDSITVKSGAAVIWINKSSENLWVGSDAHPSHTFYDGTSLREHCKNPDPANPPFDECESIAPGGSWSFTFNKIGTWNYHNHVNADATGAVTVQ